METTTQSVKPFIGDNEVATPFMAYTQQGIVWGKMPHSEMIEQPTRILVGVTVPEYVTLVDANILFVEPNFIAKPVHHAQVMLPYEKIIGFHLMPPKRDQLDYDPSEPNRIMAPVTFYMGSLMIKGSMRISEITSIKNTVEVTKADFITLYDLEVSHPNNPKMSPICTNMGYFRLRSMLIAE
jgi:hypothetical protein